MSASFCWRLSGGTQELIDSGYRAPPSATKRGGKESEETCEETCEEMCEESLRYVKRRVEAKCVNVVSEDRRDAPGKQLPFLGAHLLKIR